MITPYLLFSKSALAEDIRRLREHSASMNRHWVSALTDGMPIDLMREVVLAATEFASCRTIAHAEYLAAAGFPQIILTGRLIDAESLQRLRVVAGRTQITAVIDHFRHAELLSQCVQSCSNPASVMIRVLIEVDLGQQSTGVCPGPDAARLASAAERLPGLNVIGVFASGYDCRDDIKPGDHNADDHDAGSSAIVTIAEHGLLSIREVTSECSEIVVLMSSADDAAWSDSRVTSLITSPFMMITNPLKVINKEAGDQARSPSVLLISTVISRPTLEWCIIDAGRNAQVDASDVYVHTPAGATILRLTDDTSALQLSGAAIDLRIGDTVQLGLRRPERFLMN